MGEIGKGHSRCSSDDAELGRPFPWPPMGAMGSVPGPDSAMCDVHRANRVTDSPTNVASLLSHQRPVPWTSLAPPAAPAAARFPLLPR